MMKWIFVFVGLMVLTTMVVADNGTPPAQPDDSNGGFFVNLNVSLGLLGAGLFFPSDDERDTLFVPSVGPMLRMAYRLLVGNSAATGRRDVYLDLGVIVFATYGIVEET